MTRIFLFGFVEAQDGAQDERELKGRSAARIALQLKVEPAMIWAKQTPIGKSRFHNGCYAAAAEST